MDTLWLAMVDETLKQARLMPPSPPEFEFAQTPRVREYLHSQMREQLSCLKRGYDEANNELKTSHDADMEALQSDKENVEFFETAKTRQTELYFEARESNHLTFAEGLVPIIGLVVCCELDMEYILQTVLVELGLAVR